MCAVACHVLTGAANVGISFPLSRKKSVARLLYDMNVYLIAECLFIFGKIFDYMFHIYQLFNMLMPGVLHKGKIRTNSVWARMSFYFPCKTNLNSREKKIGACMVFTYM